MVSVQLLARSHGHAWSGPGSIEIFCKRGEIGRGRNKVRLLQRRQARLAVLHMRKGCLPALLELRGDQAIIRGRRRPLASCNSLIHRRFSAIAEGITIFCVLGLPQRADTLL
jgi:hypothetical protein